MKKDTNTIVKLAAKGDERAILQLSEQYKNYFWQIAHKTQCKNEYAKRHILDLMENKELIVFNAAKTYNPKKSKFSTYLYNYFKYLCFKTRAINNRFVALEENYDGIIPPEFQTDRPSLNIILDLIEDKNIQRIFRMRYKHKKTWHQIAKKLNKSHEWCRLVHNKTLPKLKKYLKSNGFDAITDCR